MKVAVPGHVYIVPNFEDPNNGQSIAFIHKEPVVDTTSDQYGVLRTVRDGTTNEELLKVLIDRMRFLNEKHPCRENEHAISGLEHALFWLNERTKNRLNQKVEGTYLPHDPLEQKWQVQIRYANGSVKYVEEFETNKEADDKFDEWEAQCVTSEFMTPPSEGRLVLIRHDEEGIHIMRELNIVRY